MRSKPTVEPFWLKQSGQLDTPPCPAPFLTPMATALAVETARAALLALRAASGMAVGCKARQVVHALRAAEGLCRAGIALLLAPSAPGLRASCGAAAGASATVAFAGAAAAAPSARRRRRRRGSRAGGPSAEALVEELNGSGKGFLALRDVEDDGIGVGLPPAPWRPRFRR